MDKLLMMGGREREESTTLTPKGWQGASTVVHMYNMYLAAMRQGAVGSSELGAGGAAEQGRRGGIPTPQPLHCAIGTPGEQCNTHVHPLLLCTGTHVCA